MAYATKTEVLTNDWTEISGANTTNLQVQMKGGKSAMLWIGDNPPENLDDGRTLKNVNTPYNSGLTDLHGHD